MEKKPKYKKVTRKADRLLEGKVIARQGKQKDQKCFTVDSDNLSGYMVCACSKG